MRFLGVLEIEIDVFLFAEPGDEMQVGFAVLDAILPLLIFVAELEGKGLGNVALLLEDFLDNVHLLQVLKI